MEFNKTSSRLGMYTYSQLLFRNMLFSLIFSLGIAALSVILLTKHTQGLQENFKSTVSAIAVNKTSVDDIGNALSLTKNFSFLLVQSSDGKFSRGKAVDGALKFLYPATTTVKVNNNMISITYMLDHEALIKLVLTILLIVLAITLFLSFIASKFSLSRYKKVVQIISTQIKSNLNALVQPQEKINNGTKTATIPPELNDSIKQIQQEFEQHISKNQSLEQEAYTDSITKLGNRNRFVQFFDDDKTMPAFGVLTITRSCELQTINQIHGYHEGDNYIQKIADILKASSSKFKSAKLFRLNSSDFATILPNITLKDAETYAAELTGKFNEYQKSSELDSVAYTGLVEFDKSKPLGELLALADTGISVAQTKTINAWYAQTDTNILESSSASYGNQNWRQEIDNVLDNQRVTLLIQNIATANRNSRGYSEILARFLNSNDDMLPTASFIAMAEKLDKIVDVDRMIIEQAISEITAKNLQDSHFGINISARSIQDEHFLIWLERRLLRDNNIASNLIFEISEYGLQQNIKVSKRFIDMIHRVGSRVTVEKFGVGLTSFKFFRDLKPDFIKMDSTYTRDIDEDKNNQYFLRTMVDLAHRLSIAVLAESVESQEEKFALEKLFIDGCQGYYIGKPQAL